jgi:putative ABC transport system substrate-binding protein
VGSGYVTSLAHPGGNTTGLASSQDEYAPKQLQLLAILVPNLSRVGLLVNPNNPFPLLKLAREAAQKVGVTVAPAEIQDRQDIEKAFALLTNERVSAVLSSGDALFFLRGKRSWRLPLKAVCQLCFRSVNTWKLAD